MDGDDVWLIALLVLAFAVAVFVAAGETALLRVSPIRAASLGAGGDRRAVRLAALLGKLPAVLNAVLLTALLSQIAAATITGILAQRWFGSIGVTVASIVLTLFLFIYAEAIPKTFAVRHSDRVALALASSLALLERMLRPIVRALVWIADLQAPGKGISMAPTVTEDELRRLATRAEREGEITGEDLALIDRAFRLGDRRVDDIMVPRADIVAVPADVTIDFALAIALEAGHRRLPVYEETVENIVSMVRLRDMIRVPEPRRELLAVASLALAPLVVPDSKRVLDLLREMQESRTHLAVIVDEYGGTAGLVTVEDIAEELLGSMSEAPEPTAVSEISEGRWSVDAALPVEDLAELIGSPLPEGDWNTVAGMVFALAGRVPDVGDEIRVPGCSFKVISTRRRRITRIEVSLL
ncbi:MAG TPA: hemolysin family protein [Acidimicrobiia bacterium]|nr:hemolysin family protein [Acidimicrobiia bacterium]